MSRPPFSDVAIIGGGITGPALAIELQKLGIHSTIYELRPKEYDIGGSMVLTPNALRVISRLGIYPQSLAAGFAHDTVKLTNLKDQVIGRLAVGGKEKYGYDALRLYRRTLREFLLEEAERRGVQVRYGMRCVMVSEYARVAGPGMAKVVLGFEDGTVVQADAAFGADGIHSLIREYISPTNHEPMYSGQVAVIAVADRASVKEDDRVRETKIILGTKGSFAMMPVAGGRDDAIYFFSTLELPDRSRVEWQLLQGNKEEMKGLLHRFDDAEWPAIVRGLVRDTPEERYFCSPFFHVPELERWVSKRGKVMIIGDAAHGIPPSAGQGAAMSLEDASTLALTLSHINQGGDVAESLLRWERHRKERVQKVVERTNNKSNARKATKSNTEQAEKEKKLGEEREDELFWLYGYEVESVRESLAA